jgi:adenylyl-sulfate kinase
MTPQLRFRQNATPLELGFRLNEHIASKPLGFHTRCGLAHKRLEISRNRNPVQVFGVYAVLILASAVEKQTASRERVLLPRPSDEMAILPISEPNLSNSFGSQRQSCQTDRVANLHWRAFAVNKEARSGQKLQKPVCLWLTGLSGSGKSTIADLLEHRLFAAGRHTYVLENDNIRLGLNRDLGFSEVDRVENIRRITEVSRLFVDAGLMVIVAFISPHRAVRAAARSRFDPGEFLEVFVDAPLEECERRDPKGLYAKARRGELANFTGIDSKYEPPHTPDVRLDTVAFSVEECVDQLLRVLNQGPSHVAATPRE